MFNKLFGKATPAPTKTEAPVDVEQTIKTLTAQCESISKRIKVLENKKAELRIEAVEKKKKNDLRGAKMALQQMKMYEK